MVINFGDVVAGIMITVGGAAILGAVAMVRGFFNKLNKVLGHMLVVQGVHGDALLSSLTCLRDGKCNGEVTTAIDNLGEIKKSTSELVAKVLAHR